MGASPLQPLIVGAARLGVPLDEATAQRLSRVLDELLKWNRAYNLTAITQPREMLTHHLLDSLSVQRFLAGRRVIDVGTGAGFPGLPLAIVDPQRHFTLLDSNGKKVRFVAHVVRALGLANVDAVHSRAEAFVPPQPVDTVVAVVKKENFCEMCCEFHIGISYPLKRVKCKKKCSSRIKGNEIVTEKKKNLTNKLSNLITKLKCDDKANKKVIKGKINKLINEISKKKESSFK